MEKNIKLIFLLIFGIQSTIILIELISCIFIIVTKKIGYDSLINMLEKENAVDTFFGLFKKQAVRCILLLCKQILTVFFLIFINSINTLIKRKVESDSIEISYGDEQVSIKRSSEEENATEEAKPEQKPARRNLIHETMFKVAVHLILYFENEDNIILFLSYLYIFITCASFLTNYKTAIILFFLPYVFKKTNMKLYLKYKSVKPLIFNVSVAALIASFYFVIRLNRLNYRIELKDLPLGLRAYFKENHYSLLATHEPSSEIHLEAFVFHSFAYLHVTGDFSKLNENEQLILLKRQLSFNSNVIDRLFLRTFILFLEIVTEILLIEHGRGMLVERFSVFGEYFVGYMLFKIGFYPLYKCFYNIVRHSLEYKADIDSCIDTKTSYLGDVIRKQALNNGYYASYFSIFNKFYDSRASLIARLKNLELI